MGHKVGVLGFFFLFNQEWLFPSEFELVQSIEVHQVSLHFVPKEKRLLGLLDLVLFLVIDLLFLPAVLSFRPVVTLAGDEQSASEQNTKD